MKKYSSSQNSVNFAGQIVAGKVSQIRLMKKEVRSSKRDVVIVSILRVFQN